MPTYDTKKYIVTYNYPVDIIAEYFSPTQHQLWLSIYDKLSSSPNTINLNDDSYIKAFTVGTISVEWEISSITKVSYGNFKEIYFYLKNASPYDIVRIVGLGGAGLQTRLEYHNETTNQWQFFAGVEKIQITSKEYYTTVIRDIHLSLYKNLSEQNCVDKNIQYVIDMWGNFKDATSITSPTIIIERDSIDFNYVYIEQLNRYYFVEEAVSVRNKLWQVILKVDVLMTYKTTIYNQNAFVERYGNAVTPQHLAGKLVDDKLPVEDIPTYEYYEPTNKSGSNVIEFKYVMDEETGTTTKRPNILYSAVTKVVTPMANSNDTLPPTGTTLPRIQSRRTPNTIHRLLNTSEYGYLISACISNDAPASFIRSVLLFPFDLLDVFSEAGVFGKSSYVYAGNNALETGSVWGALDSANRLQVYGTTKGCSPYILVADFIFSSEYGIDIDEDFLDLSSNTEWEIYIPFVGWTQIDARAVYGKEILIYYTVDLDTGLSTVYIYNNDDSQVIWSGTCQLGLKLPLASTNAEELARQKQAMGLNLAVGLVSSMLSMGMATPLGAVGGIMMGAKAITSAVNTHNMMIEKAQTSFGSSDNALYAPPKIIVRKVTHKVISQSYVEDVNFNHLYGRPYRRVVKLDDIKGGYYAQIGEVHLTGFDTALKSEVDEIDSLLRDGVYI